jgi:outer membrane biosynthesis protein TonB
MSSVAMPTRDSSAPALLVSLGLHACLVLLPFALQATRALAQQRPAELPNSVAMMGSSIEVEAPTPDLQAAPASAAEPAAPEPVDVHALPTEPAPAVVIEPKAPPKTEPAQPRDPESPRPKPFARPKPAAPSSSSHEASQPSSGAEASASATPSPGTFGQEGLAPGVRRLGYAFTRAIPAATPSDGAWRELPAGLVGTIRIELEVDENNHLGALKHWQAHPGEPAPPPALERMVERTLLLLRAGQFALSGSNDAGSERLTIEVVLKDEAAEEGGTEQVVQKKFDGATPGHPGRAYFRYGTGRVFEAKVTIAPVARH